MFNHIVYQQYLDEKPLAIAGFFCLFDAERFLDKVDNCDKFKFWIESK